jgi:hypothetical protein
VWVPDFAQQTPRVSADVRVCECGPPPFIYSAGAGAIFSSLLSTEEGGDLDAASSHFHSVIVRNAGARCGIGRRETR